jgi:hypothetical protein
VLFTMLKKARNRFRDIFKHDLLPFIKTSKKKNQKNSVKTYRTLASNSKMPILENQLP